jgi:dipeptidyl aminopeptidase/acylaminoacyl peptidase
MTTEDVAKIQFMTSPLISKDGSMIAYRKMVQPLPFDEDSGPARGQLWIWDADRGHRLFVDEPNGVKAIQWRPGVKELSFLAKRGKDSQTSLYVISLEGGEARKLLTHDTDLREVAWDPQGKVVAFLALAPKSEQEEARAEVGFTQEIYEEQWRPVQLFMASEKENGWQAELISLPGTASALSWSPDGRFLALALAEKNLVDEGYMYRQVTLVDVKERAVVFQAAKLGKLGSMSWSPDGDHLAFISGEDLHDPSAGRLMVLNTQTYQMDRFFIEDPVQVEAHWWHNAKEIDVLLSRGTASVLGRLSLKNGSFAGWWEGQDLIVLEGSRSETGAYGLTASSPRHPSELFLVESLSKNTKFTQLSDTNPWLKDRAFGEQKVIRYQARDGQEIEALVIFPVGFREGTTYPLIVDVHGGPEAHYSNGFLTRYASPGQVAAGKGYLVVYPNYRGSTGRGVAFSKMGQRDAAGKEFDDLVDAVDHLIDRGWADKNRVGITGGSYGGYATAWGATYYSHRFAAGVMFVGISNKLSKAGTTDIPEEEFLVHSRRRPWENWQLFLERSPIFHVERSKTPLLILHGKEDPRVHPGQSLELYRHLKTLDQAPVRLVLYPGEGHGNRKSAARYDFNVRMMRWFDHFLMEQNREIPVPDVTYLLEEKQPK